MSISVGGLPSVVRAAPRRVRVKCLSTPRGASQVRAVSSRRGAALSRIYFGALRVYSVPYSLTDLKERRTGWLTPSAAWHQAAALVGAVHPAQRSRMLELAQDPSGSHMVTSSPGRFVRILVLDQLIKIMNTCVMEFVDNPDQPRPRRGSQHVGEPGAEWPSVRQHGQHPL
jgi:hypothetical protein